MLRFRPALHPEPPRQPLTREAVRLLAADALAARHFFTSPGVRLEFEHAPRQEIAWEVFHGRLLDPRHTRQAKTFEAWDAYIVDEDGRPGEPVLSLKLDWDGRELHVVRGLLCYVWEGYDSGGGVYLSREMPRQVRELAGTIRLDQFATPNDLRDEITGRLFQAVVGASRLPLTSVEAPLPVFSLGRLAYFYRPDARDAMPMRTWRELAEETGEVALSAGEDAKLLETLLHAVPPAEMEELARNRERGRGRVEVLRRMFNEASLSPWTDLTDKALALLGALERQGHVTESDAVDFLAHLLRQTGRHLTAYDLITFHHRGANYPDALLLDAVLKDYLRHIERAPALFLDAASDTEPARREKRRRRRALRQGWLPRRFYEGHPVPDAPTSPGENARVLPPPHLRVPEEQVLHPGKRTRRLYADDPLTDHAGEHGRRALEQSIDDLRDPLELRELGTALFLDRPLGAGKAPGEPDQTILLSHLAFSASIARRRLKYLTEGLHLIPDVSALEDRLDALTGGLGFRGVPLSEVGGHTRPGAVSAADARQVADDFVFLRTTDATARDFFSQFDFDPLLTRFSLGVPRETGPLLILPAAATGRPGEVLAVYDERFRRRLDLVPDLRQGYASRAGAEYPAAGLRAIRARDEAGREHDLSGEPIIIPAHSAPASRH